ncbi:kinase-like domain-containing protein [Crepidotus variabilis]|uniref:Kinase-like domain-containing protein n=1 Tax=Crepidotus variabilis TaxID=179855 RepID=A0A9P6JTY2_9AGAR|nr:kinase-like domain-containing protein [Crepidotus variabilis]
MASTLQSTSSYLEPGTSSWRFRSPAASSTSSLCSTLSDFTSSTSLSSSPPAPKTNAFFASPFPTRAHSPDLPTPPAKPTPARSLTADFFSTPTRTPSPPVEPQSAKSAKSFYFASRIFPSRYTSTARRSPVLDFVTIEDPEVAHERALSSAGSDSSVTSQIEDKRLPTPPPPVSSSRLVRRETTLGPHSRLDEQSIDQTTPRPPDAEPTLLFERSLLFAKNKMTLEPEPEVNDEPQVVDDLNPGSLISIPSLDFAASQLSSPISTTVPITSPPPTRSSFLGFQKSDFSRSDDTIPFSSSDSRRSDPESVAICTSTTPNQIGDNGPSSISSHPTAASTLRLVRPLGHGAFSSVWLAEDLSQVPLTLVSKKSVRDLRRRASGRDHYQEHAKEKPTEGAPPTPDSAADRDFLEPKRNRLRDGLKSMLLFSKVQSSSPTSAYSSLPTTPTTPITPSSREFQETIVSEVGPLSRHPSYRSTDSANSSDNVTSHTTPGSAGLSSPPGIPQLRLQLDNGMMSLSRDSSLKKFKERVRGTKPGYLLGRAYLDERHGGMGEPLARGVDDFGFLHPRHTRDGSLSGSEGSIASLSRQSSIKKSRGKKDVRLVAVKLTPRRAGEPLTKRGAKEEEERTRVGFVREVEVLKHISHPNITPLLAHLSTPDHHILVLPYLPGGDLLGLVNNDESWGKLSESILRRIWCELCKAVGWMHGVGLVHRDIKLENILLTTSMFPSTEDSSTPVIPPAHMPLIKLTDFGLSRFVEIDAKGDAELLTTRCGSEAYAAPELVIGGRAGYDARKTDAWACGVVLYALVGRKLPFGEGIVNAELNGGKIGGERNGREGSLSERRHWLMKIARGEWVWPDGGGGEDVEMPAEQDGDHSELVGQHLARSNGAKRIVERLLVRDPKKRARIVDLWQDVWMCGGEDEAWWREREKQRAIEEEIYRRLTVQDLHSCTPPVVRDFAYEHEVDEGRRWFLDQNMQGLEEDCMQAREQENEEEDEEDQRGYLLDEGTIDSITRQEVV